MENVFTDWRDVRRVDGGAKKDVLKLWGRELRCYREIGGPVPCCETCLHVGGAMWHCMCGDSVKYGINVVCWDLCAQYRPNRGLLFYLSNQYWRASHAVGYR